MKSNSGGKEANNVTLDNASIGCPMAIELVEAPGASPEWSRWLEEIGFIAGERVMVMARALPGGDPLVIRVGQSTFALRRAEAACVQVSPIGSVLDRDSFGYGIFEGGLA